jgi:thymidylate kinase
MRIDSMPDDSIPQAALTRYLRELPNYVVLRNEEDLFGNLQRGGDLDLLVGDMGLAERILIHNLGAPVRVIRSSYVSGYSYDWGHVDLLPTVEWRGACYLLTEAVLAGRQLSPRGRPVPRIAHEALISWLSSLLWGGFFKERYAAEIRQAVEIDGSEFRQTLVQVAGKKLGLRLWQAAVDGHAETSREWTRSLRLAVWSRACLKSPVRTIQRCVAFVIGALRLRFEPPVPWIAIVGRDGTGKTSLTNGIVRRFAACPYGNVHVIHWRSRFMARAHEEPVTDLHRGRSRGSIGGWRLLALAADWLICYWTRWAHLRAKGYILAFERTYFDVVMGHMRDRDGDGPRLGRTLWSLLPKPDLVFVLDSKADVPSHRQLQAVHLSNGRSPLSAVVDQIQCVIREWMLSRSAASLGVHASTLTSPTARAVAASSAPSSVSRTDNAR